MNLTPRQDEIIFLISHGKTDKAIAAHLKIKECTVGFHVRKILKRLKASSRAHAVRKRYLKK